MAKQKQYGSAVVVLLGAALGAGAAFLMGRKSFKSKVGRLYKEIEKEFPLEDVGVEVVRKVSKKAKKAKKA